MTEAIAHIIFEYIFVFLTYDICPVNMDEKLISYFFFTFAIFFK